MADTRTYRGVTYRNGELPKSLQKKVNGKHGTLRNADAYLRIDAADALNGAIAEIKDKYGYDLTIRGWNRTRAEQEKFFYQRWTTTPYRGRPTKRWNGKTWYLKPGYAAASAPGYSNHGWGTTIDVNDFGTVGQFNNPNRNKYYPILRKWGFDDSEGRGHIREPWHLEYKPSMDKMSGKAQHKDSKDWFEMASKKELEQVVDKAVDRVARDVMMYSIDVGGATKRAIGKGETNAASLLRYAAASVYEVREQHAETMAALKELTKAVQALAEKD